MPMPATSAPTPDQPTTPPEESIPYQPSPQMAARLDANRQGKLTPAQRTPIILAAAVTGPLLLCPAVMVFSVFYSLLAGFNAAGWLGIILAAATLVSFGFLGGVLWVNARMFVPEALARRPVRWERAPLEIKLAERERPEMPFSYLVGDYSFAPFVAPNDVPLQTGREYIVYYTPRSRLLLSLAPTDQPESADWLPMER